MSEVINLAKRVIVSSVKKYPGIHRTNLLIEVSVVLVLVGFKLGNDSILQLIDQMVEESLIKETQRCNKRFKNRVVKNYFPVEYKEKESLKVRIKKFLSRF